MHPNSKGFILQLAMNHLLNGLFTTDATNFRFKGFILNKLREAKPTTTVIVNTVRRTFAQFLGSQKSFLLLLGETF
jgi:hypothetical protein